MWSQLEGTTRCKERPQLVISNDDIQCGMQLDLCYLFLPATSNKSCPLPVTVYVYKNVHGIHRLVAI
jgi:hypothetical protein